MLGDHPRDKRDSERVEFMGDAEIRQGQDAGVTEDRFVGARRRRISRVRGRDIRRQKPLDFGKAGNELLSDGDGFFPASLAERLSPPGQTKHNPRMICSLSSRITRSRVEPIWKPMLQRSSSERPKYPGNRTDLSSSTISMIWARDGRARSSLPPHSFWTILLFVWHSLSTIEGSEASGPAFVSIEGAAGTRRRRCLS